MKLTKFQHACLVIEKNGKSLVIDPGNLSDDFVSPNNVVAVILTHAHPDHLDDHNLESIAAKNPDITIIGHKDVVGNLTMAPIRTVESGDEFEIGPFLVKFFGEKHAEIHSSMPLDTNVGVMVNGTFYYPGDSFTQPDSSVETLALPLSGPWLKMGESIDFLLAVKPRMAFSTHDAHLSKKGEALVDYMVPLIIKDSGITYQRLTTPIEVNG